MPRNLTEVDRKKNQFDKEERLHLLGIMKQYAPLLDSSASTLARKKIWTIIEDEFKKAGFTRKTSAQLKKYWQNYKYHCKKARTLGKENKKRVDLEINESPEWNRYQILVENRPPPKYSDIPGVFQSLHDRSQGSLIESGCRSEMYEDNEGSSRKFNTSDSFIDLSQIKTEQNDNESTSHDDDGREINPSENGNLEEDSLEEKKEIFASEDRQVSSTNAVDHKTRNRIVVSNAKISNNSVTVSIVYPENNEHARKSTVGKTSEAPSSSVSLSSGKSAEEDKRNREDSFELCDFEEHSSRENFNERNFDTSIEEYDSFEYTANDLACEKQTKKNRTSASVEKQENDAIVRSRGSETTRGDPFGRRGYVFLTDYRNQLKHKLLLQQLETEEKRLKVKIAEMAIQEVQLRIKALNEDMRRTEELHQLHLARAACENLNF